jgi:cytochrome c553
VIQRRKRRDADHRAANSSVTEKRDAQFAADGTMSSSCRAIFIAIAAVTVSYDAVAVDAKAGRTKAAACVPCHGENGLSIQPNAPHLAGQPAMYIADQLRQFRAGKRPSEVMGVIAKPLTDTQIDDLAAWYASIRLEARPPE